MPRPPSSRRRPRRLRRHPPLYWAVAVAVAVLTGTTVARLVGGAAAEVARYGEVRTVPVATRDLPVGHVLTAADVELRAIPAAFVPVGEVAADPAGAVLVVPLVAGEVVLAARLAPHGLGRVASLVPPGHVAVAVPADTSSLGVAVGDRVDLLATFDPSLAAAEGADPTVTVALGAPVVDIADQAVTVAVPRTAAPRVAFALAHGVVTVALAGPPAGPPAG